MTHEQPEEARFRRALLMSPGERQDVDYKASVAFAADDEFALKLIKHIQGMANNGGGWIVIGYDDKTNAPDGNHSGDVAASYDPTTLSGAVNSTVERGQQIRLTVHQETHPDSGLPHPIIQVRGFERVPFVCRTSKQAVDTGASVLQQGKVYIRRPGAATSEVSTSHDWEELIERCLQQRRDELLTQFQDLFQRMTSSERAAPSRTAAEGFEAWVDQVRRRAHGRE